MATLTVDAIDRQSAISIGNIDLSLCYSVSDVEYEIQKLLVGRGRWQDTRVPQ